ncbi:hypothetical protein BCV72DRAFT_260422 [Rhizopus microsporus var. microsporus]|uniref:WRKY domain-containing protein n=2 Tax=Rhizopus microsporus TaxID=58291 RepID=A0A2G4T2D6_RHIZD|nr:uncharacterized protein RHIMIDRAFT_289640 [Rhizopus microsporus ATCC 52813]ORE09960.1 hypothetical protein BCV72DRAFT_260422 [Rhizopus microsporus var. microsporus]PHZ15167.1 hypothetical protein RHIMIDRAFT_289640 [Rhizopus microsporus ATCC 52813]
MSDNAYTAKYDLQDLIQQYKTQPDLLKLILTSKVEEDKRRAEEAKLKAKELDLLLQQQSLKRKSSFQEESIEKRRHSAAAAMLAMGGGGAVIPNQQQQQQQQSLVHSIIQPLSPIQQRSSISSMSSAEDISSAYPSPVAEEDDYVKSSSRRRREMQAITKIVETREHPYIDNYFWKNNGNTVQKKTGCKSVYYKCSNSNKGCTVNKTVTARPNGEYLIKYRGCHLKECGKVERIRDL